MIEAVARREPQAVALRPESFPELLQIAEMLAKSNLVPSAIRQKPADVAVILLTGHELGLGPMQAIRGINVIEGKASLSADLMIGLVKNSGSVEYFRLVSSDDTAAEYEAQRGGDPTPTKLRYTIEQARAAGLATKDNWKRHPAAMLRARCAAALARVIAPDVTMGLYDPDEAEEITARQPRRPRGGALPREGMGALGVGTLTEEMARGVREQYGEVSPEVAAIIDIPAPIVTPAPAEDESAPLYEDGVIQTIRELSGNKSPYWSIDLEGVSTPFMTFDTAIRDTASAHYKMKGRVRIIYEITSKGGRKIVELLAGPATGGDLEGIL